MKHAHSPRKALALFLALILLATLCACARPGGASPAVSPSPTPSATPTPTVTPSPTPSPSPTSALDAYNAVLQDGAAFYSTSLGKNITIDQIKQELLITDDSISVKVDQFTVVDLNHDGTPEVVLNLNVSSDNYYGSEVLWVRDGAVYGCYLYYRAFYSIKTDGTFSYSLGGMDNGFSTMSFTKDACVIDQTTYCQSSFDTNNNVSIAYFVNHQSATEDAFTTAMNQQNAKPDVAWVDFTAGNIISLLSGGQSGISAPPTDTPEPPSAAPTPAPIPSSSPTPTPTVAASWASKELNLRFTAPANYTMVSQSELDNRSTESITYVMAADGPVTGEGVAVYTVAVTPGSAITDYFAALDKDYSNIGGVGEYAVKYPDAPEKFAGESYYVGSVVGTFGDAQTAVSTLFARFLNDGALLVVNMTSVIDQTTANQRDFFSKY